MDFYLDLIIVAILLGAILQVGIGIGFSIIAGPPAMIFLGTSVAVPILLLLNTIVSFVATDWRTLRTSLNEAFEHFTVHRQTVGFVLVQDTQRRDSIVESSSLPYWQRSCVLG